MNPELSRGKHEGRDFKIPAFSLRLRNPEAEDWILDPDPNYMGMMG